MCKSMFVLSFIVLCLALVWSYDCTVIYILFYYFTNSFRQNRCKVHLDSASLTMLTNSCHPCLTCIAKCQLTICICNSHTCICNSLLTLTCFGSSPWAWICSNPKICTWPSSMVQPHRLHLQWTCHSMPTSMEGSRLSLCICSSLIWLRLAPPSIFSFAICCWNAMLLSLLHAMFPFSILLIT